MNAAIDCHPLINERRSASFRLQVAACKPQKKSARADESLTWQSRGRGKS